MPPINPPRRLHSADNFAAVHALLTASFASMDGVIDPPSSLHAMTAETLRAQAESAEFWVIDPGPLACVILTPQPDTLYLGKLAVTASHQGKGLARQLVSLAVQRAQVLGLPSVTLQTRIELTDNHAAFQRLGFVEVARTAHKGYTRPTAITYRRAT
jgi:predicted N-acetyltransferase YhbS